MVPNETASSTPVAANETGWARFCWGVMLVIGCLFLAGEVSNALVHLHPLQKDGNHYDESEISLAIRDGEPASSFIARRHWGPPVVYEAYVLNKVFGAETYGRRIFALGLVLASLIWLIWLARRQANLRVEEIVLLVFLWAVAGGLTPYTTLGLIPYPLRVFCSVLLIHLTLFVFQKDPGRWGLALSAGLLVLVVYADVSFLVAVCAVAGTACAGDALHKGIGPRQSLRALMRMSILLVPPVGLALYLILSNPHPELVNPNRNLDLYFPTSDFPKNAVGLLSYSVENSVRLIRGTLALHPIIAKPFGGLNSGYLAGAFFCVGLLSSLFSLRGRCFPLALFLVLGLLGHYTLSLVRLVPYGDLRYFLPFFPLFPFFAALGVGVSVRLLARWVPPRPARVAVACALLALLCGQALGVARLAKVNGTVRASVSREFQRLYAEDAPEALVLDDWTACTGRDAYPDLLERPHYVLETNLRTQWRGDAPGKRDDMKRWETFLAAHERISVVTSIPFSAKYYGPLHTAASSRFQLESHSQLRRWYFSELRQRDANLLAEPRDLSSPAWLKEAAHASGTAGGESKVVLEPGGTLEQIVAVEIAAGQVLDARLGLRAETPCEVRLVLKRAEKAPYEGNSRVVQVGTARHEANLSHVFQQSWRKISFSIVGPADRGVTLWIDSPELNIGRQDSSQ